MMTRIMNAASLTPKTNQAIDSSRTYNFYYNNICLLEQKNVRLKSETHDAGRQREPPPEGGATWATDQRPRTSLLLGATPRRWDQKGGFRRRVQETGSCLQYRHKMNVLNFFSPILYRRWTLRKWFVCYWSRIQLLNFKCANRNNLMSDHNIDSLKTEDYSLLTQTIHIWTIK